MSSPQDGDEAQEIVTDVFNPDDERQDDGAVTPQPTRQNIAVVDDPSLSPEVANAAAAEIEAAELGDAATASQQYQGGDAAQAFHSGLGPRDARIEHAGRFGGADDGLRGQHRIRRGERLDAGGDVHGLAEEILPLVEAHGQAWPFVDADLQLDVVATAQRIADERSDGQFRLVFNTGEAAGQTVFHVHAHVLAGELQEGTLAG